MLSLTPLRLTPCPEYCSTCFFAVPELIFPYEKALANEQRPDFQPEYLPLVKLGRLKPAKPILKSKSLSI